MSYYNYCCLVVKSCLTLWNPMDCSTPGFPVLHYLPESVQIHIHRVDDAILPPHPLPPSSPLFSAICKASSDSHFAVLHSFFLGMVLITGSCSVQFSSVTQSCLTLCDPHESQHARLPCPSPTPRVHSDSRPSSPWCHPAISSSVVPFSSCPQSLPASESFPMSQLFAWGGQSTGVSALASFLPKNTQGWSPSEWTGWISLQSKGLSRVFSNTTVQKRQFFSAQPSSQSNSHCLLYNVTNPCP